MNKKLLFSLTIILFLAGHIFAQDEFTLVKEGEKAPDFTFETAPGKTQKLSDFQGKIVWINFFATWCGPCRKELPLLQKEVYDRYKNNNNFVLLIIGREHTWQEIDQFKKEQGFTMPFYPDPERKIFSVYANQNIPRNFIVDKNGMILMSTVGFTKKEFNNLTQKVEKLLKN